MPDSTQAERLQAIARGESQSLSVPGETPLVSGTPGTPRRAAPQSTAPRTSGGGDPRPGTGDYRDLVAIAQNDGFTVTSRRGGRHNRGSLHGSGQAIDVRTRDKTPAQIEAIMRRYEQAGYVVRDERTRPPGQAVWSGPHLHIQIGGGGARRTNFGSGPSREGEGRSLQDIANGVGGDISTDFYIGETRSPITGQPYNRGATPFSDPGFLQDVNADNQPTTAKWWGAAVQTLGQVAGGTVSFAGYLGEAPKVFNLLRGSEVEFGNALITAGNAITEGAEQAAPIFLNRTEETGLFGGNGLSNLFSAGYWASNAPTIASTLAMLAPGMAVGRAAGLIGTLGAEALGAGIGTAAKIGQGANILAQTGAMWLMENTQQAHQVWDQQYKEAMEGLDPSNTEYAKREAEARRVASESAATTMRVGYATLATELLQTAAIFKGVNMANRAITRTLASVDPTAITNPVLKGIVRNISQYGDDVTVAASREGVTRRELGKLLATNFGTEGLEEAYQNFAVEEGNYQGRRQRGEGEERSFAQRVGDHLSNPETYETFLWGGIGGLIFEGARTALTEKVYKNETEREAAEIQKLTARAENLKSLVTLGDEGTIRGDENFEVSLNGVGSIASALQGAHEGTLGYSKAMLGGIVKMNDEQVKESFGEDADPNDVRAKAASSQRQMEEVESAYNLGIKSMDVPKEFEALRPVLVAKAVEIHQRISLVQDEIDKTESQLNEYLDDPAKLALAGNEAKILQEKLDTLESVESALLERSKAFDTKEGIASEGKFLQNRQEEMKQELQEQIRQAAQERATDGDEKKPLIEEDDSDLADGTEDPEFADVDDVDEGEFDADVQQATQVDEGFDFSDEEFDPEAVQDTPVADEATEETQDPELTEADPLATTDDDVLGELFDQEPDMDAARTETEDPLDEEEALVDPESVADVATDPEAEEDDQPVILDVDEVADEDAPVFLSVEEDDDIEIREADRPAEEGADDDYDPNAFEDASDDTGFEEEIEYPSTEEQAEGIIETLASQTATPIPVGSKANRLAWRSDLRMFHPLRDLIRRVGQDMIGMTFSWNGVGSREFLEKRTFTPEQVDLIDSPDSQIEERRPNEFYFKGTNVSIDPIEIPVWLYLSDKDGKPILENGESVEVPLYASRSLVSGMTNDEALTLRRERMYIFNTGEMEFTVTRVGDGVAQVDMDRTKAENSDWETRLHTSVRDLIEQTKDTTHGLAVARSAGVVQNSRGDRPTESPTLYKKGSVYLYVESINGNIIPVKLNKEKLTTEAAEAILTVYEQLVRDPRARAEKFSLEIDVETPYGRIAGQAGDILNLLTREGFNLSQDWLNSPEEATRNAALYLRSGSLTIGQFDPIPLGKPLTERQREKIIEKIQEYKHFNVSAKAVGGEITDVTNGREVTLFGKTYSPSDSYDDFIYDMGAVTTDISLQTQNGPTTQILTQHDVVVSAAVVLPRVEAEEASVADDTTEETSTNDDDHWDTLFRRADSVERKADVQRELAWLKENLPNTAVELEADLIRALNGDLAWGSFHKGLIRLSQNMAEGTAFHEAFHAVMHSYLTKVQRDSHLDETAKRYDVDRAEVGDVWLEEKLAEEFREYVMSNGRVVLTDATRANSFFGRIWNWLQNLIGVNRDTTLDLFNRINSGGFAKMMPSDTETVMDFKVPGMTVANARETADVLVYAALEAAQVVLPTDIQHLGTQRRFIRESMDEETKAKFQKKDLYLTLKSFVEAKAKRAPEGYRENWQKLLEPGILEAFVSEDGSSGLVVMHLQGMGINVKSGKMEVTDEGDVGSHTKASYEFSSRDKASSAIRAFLSLQPMLASSKVISEDEGKGLTEWQRMRDYDRAGNNFLDAPRMVPQGRMWTTLQDLFVGAVPRSENGVVLTLEQEMIRRMEENQSDPQVKRVLLYVQDPNTPSEFKTLFFQAFSKIGKNYHYDRYHIIVDNNTGADDSSFDEYSLYTEPAESSGPQFMPYLDGGRRSAESNGAGLVVRTEWEDSLAQKSIETLQSALILSREIEALSVEEHRRLKNGGVYDVDAVVTGYVRALNMAGVKVSEQALLKYLDSKGNRVSSLLTLLKNSATYFWGQEGDSNTVTALIEGKELEKSPVESASFMSRLAGSEATTRGIGIDFSVRSPDGKTFYSVSQPTLLYNELNEMREYPKRFAGKFTSAFSKGSQYLAQIAKAKTDEAARNMIDVRYESSLSIASDGGVQAPDELTMVDRLIQALTNVLEGSLPNGTAAMPTLNMADKAEQDRISRPPVYYRDVLSRQLDKIQNVKASEAMAGYALAELQRIAEVHAQIETLEDHQRVDHYHPQDIALYKKWRAMGSPSLSDLTELFTYQQIEGTPEELSDGELAKARETGKKKAETMWKKLGGGVKLHLFPELEYNRLMKIDKALAGMLYSPDGTPLVLDTSNKEIVRKVRAITDHKIKREIKLQLEAMEAEGLITKKTTATGKPFYNAERPILTRQQYFHFKTQFGIFDWLEGAVSEFVVNTMASNIEQMMLFVGDPAFYKSDANPVTNDFGGDMAKRTPRVKAYTEHLSNLQSPWLPNGIKQSYNFAVINDVEDSSEYHAEIKDGMVKGYVALGMSEAEATALAEQTSRIYDGSVNRADAQGYAHHAWWRENQIRLGLWSADHQEVYDMLIKDALTDADKTRLAELQPLVSLTFQQDKPFVTGNRVHEATGATVPYMVKYSRAILFPALVQGNRPLGAILSKMEKQNLQEVAFSSAVKVGGEGAISFEDAISDEPLHSLPFNPITLPTSGWGKQVEVNTKGFKKGIDRGTQQANNIRLDVILDGTYDVPDDLKRLLGKDSYKGIDLVREIDRAYAGLAKSGWRTLASEFEAVNVDGRWMLQGSSKVYDLMREALEERGGSVAWIQTLDGKPTVDLSLHPGRLTIQSLLFSIINKRVAKAGTPGGVMVQQSALGMTKPRKYTELAESDQDAVTMIGTEPLLPPRFVDGKFVGGDVLLPSYFKDMIPNADTLTAEEWAKYFAKNPELLRVVSYRIPNQAKSSIDVLNVRGFLPSHLGDTVVLYDEITAKTGSDFDIDKMYVMTPAVFKTPKGEVRRVEFINTNTEEGLKKIYNRKYGYLRAKFEELQEVANRRFEESGDTAIDDMFAAIFPQFEEEDRATVDDYGRTLDEKWDFLKAKYEESMSFDEWKDTLEDRDPYTMNTSKAIANRILDLYYTLYSDSRTYAEAMTPVDAHTTHLQAISKALKPFYESAKGSFASFRVQAQKGLAFSVGKKMIGAAANNLSHHSKAQIAKLEIQVPESLGLFKFNEGDEWGYASLHARTDVNGFPISQTISGVLSGSMDVAKEPWVSYLGMDLKTVDTAMFLIRIGIDPKSVAYFLSQPAIREWSRREAGRNSIGQTDKSRPENAVRKWLEEKSKTSEETGKYLPFTEASLVKSLDPKSKEDWEFQKEVFTVFLEAFERATDLRDATISSKFDVENLSYDISHTLARVEMVYAVADRRTQDETPLPVFKNYEKLFDKTLDGFIFGVAKNFVGTSETQGIMGELFYEGSHDFITSMLGTAGYLRVGGTNGLSDRDSDRLRDITSGLVARQMARTGLIPTGRAAEELFTSTPQLLQAAKDANPRNPLLQRLRVATVGDDKIEIITARDIQGGQFDLDEMIVAWEELLADEESAPFAKKLIEYALVTSGMKRGPHTFFEAIPPSYMKSVDLASQQIDPFRSAIDLLRSPLGVDLRRKMDLDYFKKKTNSNEETSANVLQYGEGGIPDAFTWNDTFMGLIFEVGGTLFEWMGQNREFGHVYAQVSPMGRTVAGVNFFNFDPARNMPNGAKKALGSIKFRDASATTAPVTGNTRIGSETRDIINDCF